MPLDRQDIEKRDFPIGRRGYDPDSVDAHLRVIADELEAVRQAAKPSSESLAVAASAQVLSIVEAAETSAAGIQREADQEAAEIRRRAQEEVDRSRAEAAAQAREHVIQVSEATSVMLQRVDAMEVELGALVESLRTGANRLTADLALLQGNMGELRAAGTGGGAGPETVAPPSIEPEPEFEPEPERELELAPERELELAPEPTPAPERDFGFAAEPRPEPEPPVEVEVEAVVETVAFEPAEGGLEATLAEEEPQVEPAEPMPAGRDDDSEGARLIALNMALNGTPRDETDRYLAENFDLADRARLLDEVYARVG